MNAARRRSLLPAAVLLLALAVRLPGIDRWPPAIHQDEASNGVDGWSLLTTGADRAGRVAPVFLEGFGAGDNRTALYAILTIPCIALLGPGPSATRLPAALAGTWTVLMVFLLLRRIRSTASGLCAAVLLAVNPWDLYLSRFGHEASLTPAFLVTALWILGTPHRREAQVAVSRTRWIAAGLVLAAGMYTYPSFRVFMPLLLLAAVIARAGPRSDRRSPALLVALAAGMAPLLLAALAHPERLLARPGSASVLGNVRPLGLAVWVIAEQYLRHFLPDFLFLKGDGNPLHSPAGGELYWIELPALVLGLVVALRRRDRWDRMFLVWLALYPVASAASLGDRAEYVPHSLRAAVGLPVFQLLGGEGTAAAFSALSRKKAGVSRVAWGAGAAGLALSFALRAASFAGAYAREVAPLYHAAYPPAMRFLAGGRGRYTAAVVSARDDPQAYIDAILYRVQTPREYQESEKVVTQTETFHLVHRAGRLYYIHDPEDLKAVRATVHGRIWAVVRPGELSAGRLLAAFPYANGSPGLEIREIDLPPDDGIVPGR